MSNKINDALFTDTFKGAYTVWRKDWSDWTLICCYGHIRINYSSVDLRDGWIHRSFHLIYYHYLKSLNFHIAYRKTFPYLKIGFNSIKDLFID